MDDTALNDKAPDDTGAESGPRDPGELLDAPTATLGGSEADQASEVPDATLGGYIETHTRPPAFEGSDGAPYTVSIEIEKTASLSKPYQGFLVFPRWADTGLGVLDHVETPILWEATTRDAIEEEAHGASLSTVKRRLDEAIALRDSRSKESD